MLREGLGPFTSGINFTWSPPDGASQETRPPEGQTSTRGFALVF